MSGGTDDLSMFCEQCGAHRDQTVREAALETCGSCGKSVCPNCWNLTAGACLACVPFALPIAFTDEPAPARARTPDPVTAAPVAVAAAASRRPRMPRRRGSDRPTPAPRPPRPRQTRRPASRAVIRLGIATVAGSFVATVAVAFILASWAGHGGAAVVDAGAAKTPPPAATATASPSPTPTPTPRPTARPRVTHRPAVQATPKPRPKPTARPTRKPTPKPPPLVAFLSCSVSDFTVMCTGDASRSGGSYTWTFGDGSSGTGESASHTYAEPGMYHVSLTVKVGGASASDSTTAKVSGP